MSANQVNGLDIRVELAGIADSAITAFDEMLAAAAIHVVRDRWTAAPGIVFADIVADHIPDTTVPHLMWAPPMPWATLHSVTLPGDLDVKWLLAFPISEEERLVVRDQGFDVLDDKLSNRKSSASI